jgi:predicted ATPase
MQKGIYIITGGPGFGKTKLTEVLRSLGYLCSGEFARDLIEQQLHSGGEILPWKNPKLFQQEILRQRISFFESVTENTLAFADRGIPDQLAFARYKGFGSPEILLESVRNFRYAQLVFVTPPWPAIFRNDSIRTETFDEAVKIHQSVLDTYSGLNYELIELPLITTTERCEFILQTIKTRTNEHEST